ncbi:hypothetical protein E1293_13545 [Actinomadura darangshiensis]|uniref:Secreted protein n=1 Tax=Actinomadura darangshiensis TaxID=705336 RepID=A0A4R5BJT6_9ACTN|nr:hypothetical protein [Actinomadura darangshiensis]TDD84042.1 hypothetical protein E1293_13545 [Actinomadura darangshiensis]
MRRSLVSAAVAGAALLALPLTAHAADNDVHTVPLPFLWPRAELDDVAPDGSGGVWIGGGQGAYCVPWIDTCALYSAGNPVVRRWTGSSWREYAINGWTGNGLIAKVVSGAGQTWLGGSAYDSGYVDQLFTFDGSAFQKVGTPSSASVRLFTTGRPGTWIAQAVYPDSDQPRLLRRDGSTWRGFDVPDRRTIIDDVQGLSETDVWAVGARPGEDGTGRRPAVAHFDGTSWTWAAAPSGSKGITRVLPVGPDDVWATLDNELAHWDGTAWTAVDGPADQIADLTADGTGTLWASTPYDEGDRLFRYAGGSWQAVAVPSGMDLWDITATGTSTIWGVGRANDAPAAVSTF